MEVCAEGNHSKEAVEPSVAVVVLKLFLVCFIMLTSMVSNFLVGFAINRPRRPDMISWSSNKLLSCLTVANFALAVSVVPSVFVPSLLRCWPFGLTWCKISALLTNLLSTASVWTAMFLSIDRYHCIVNSLNYPIIMSHARTYLFIGLSLFLGLFIAILPIAGWGKYGFNMSASSCMVVWESAQSGGYTKFYAVVAFFIPLMVMVWAYYHILKAARRQGRVGQIAVLPLSLHVRVNSISSTASIFMGSKAIWITFIVLGTLCFLWGPYVIVMLLKSSSVSVSRGIEVTAVLLSFSSSTVYPCIYGFRVRAIRKEIKRIIRHRLCDGSLNAVRPLSGANDTGFVASSHFRNHSVSDGSLHFALMDNSAKVVRGIPLPPKRKTSSTNLESSKEASSTEVILPGAVM